MKLKTILTIAWFIGLVLTTIVITYIYKEQLILNKRVSALERMAKKYTYKTGYEYTK